MVYTPAIDFPLRTSRKLTGVGNGFDDIYISPSGNIRD